MVISGPPKVGKSFLLNGIVAACLVANQQNDRFFGIKSEPIQNILGVDTEQNRYKVKQNSIGIAKRMDIEHRDLDKRFSIASIMGFTVKERQEMLPDILAFPSELCIIDGITDFVTTVNDEVQCNEVTQQLITACNFGKSIITIIHEKKDGSGSRGHIGAQLERKCTSVIVISKDRKSGVHTIELRFARNSGDFEPIHFLWSKEFATFILLDEMQKTTLIKSSQLQGDENKIAALQACYSIRPEWSKIDLVPVFAKYAEKSIQTIQKTWFKEAVERQYIILNSETNKYTFNEKFRKS